MSPEWFAEIEPFPCAVLQHHWPDVPNLGDMIIIPTVVDMGYMPAPDILVGGTPCQAYSVAGKREGLSDPRGMLTLKFVEIADAIDRQRDAGDECVIVWENVPGVLSSKDNAFGCFLGDLAGEDCELVPPGRKWSNAGCVFGPKRTVAWRILDAQYFGVAQRRRRVFVVASARKGFDPTAVLFEREGVRRDTAPSREAGTVVAALTANGVGTCGADDNQGQAGHLIPQVGFRMVAFGEYSDDETASTMKARDYKDATDLAVAYSVALRGREGGATAELGDEVAGCLRASTGGGDKPHVLAYSVRTANTSSNGWGIQEEVTHTLDTAQGVAVSYALTSGQESLTPWEQQGMRVQGENGVAPTLMCNPAGGMKLEPVLSDLSVRRLIPVECERLQGFPDCHTRVPYRGKPASDGPRYKALGNSMAVCCMEWIGRRIVEQLGRL